MQLGAELDEFLGKFEIQHSPYRPQTNGAVEAANKNVKKILAKMIDRGGRDWGEKLPFALWTYRTSVRASTGCSPICNNGQFYFLDLQCTWTPSAGNHQAHTHDLSQLIF